jgi:transposase
MVGLALQVQEGLGRNPHAGDLYIFRGRRGDLVKILPDYAPSSAVREAVQNRNI